MRISKRKCDIGYCSDTSGLKVYLNGLLIENVVTADTSRGVVVSVDTDSKEIIKTGSVRIEAG